jgi:hypothetical protein
MQERLSLPLLLYILQYWLDWSLKGLIHNFVQVSRSEEGMLQYFLNITKSVLLVLY